MSHDPGPITTDIPCLHCGYRLRGLDIDTRCPECGEPVRDSTHLWREDVDITLLPWIRQELSNTLTAIFLTFGAIAAGFLLQFIGIAAVAVLVGGVAILMPIISLIFAAQFIARVHEFRPSRVARALVPILCIMAITAMALLPSKSFTAIGVIIILGVLLINATFSYQMSRITTLIRHRPPELIPIVSVFISLLGFAVVACFSPIAAAQGTTTFDVIIVGICVVGVDLVCNAIAMAVLLGWLRKTWPIHARLIAHATHQQTTHPAGSSSTDHADDDTAPDPATAAQLDAIRQCRQALD